MTTRDQEHHQLNAALRAIDADPDTWTVTQPDRERPDYVVSSPRGEVGVEVTEILLDDQGEHRAGERALAAALHDVVRDYLVQQGGSGSGSIDGNAPRINSGPHKLDIPDIADQLREHLAAHGTSLVKDGGFMDEPFEHTWGSISSIRRSDRLQELMMFHDRRGELPTYKRGRDQADIEAMVVAAIEKKVRLAANYERNWPLWLALRNPNQRLTKLSPPCLARARMANGSCFARIFLYNDPEDVLDARPPGPQFLDLLPWPPPADVRPG